MNEIEKENLRLKKVIENRESTIAFLNEILDAQSNSIAKLRAMVESNEELDEFEELKEKYENLLGEVRYYQEVIGNLNKKK